MEIARAYEPFVAALLAGDFGPPSGDAWSAEMVAAHVALNNEAFTAAARTLLEGGAPVYDNEVAVDHDELRSHVARLGDRTAIAEWVRRSAQELGALYGALTPEQREAPLPTRIRDGDTVVVDEERPLGAMIEGNATFHLDLHFSQLNALRAS